MARVKLTEYRAKKIVLGEGYPGVSLTLPNPILPPEGRYVLKVDQGIKKRMKQGLVALDLAPGEFKRQMKEWEGRGFSHFIAEPLLPHEASEERYLSLERVRNGIRVLYAREGGIDIEAHPEKVRTFILKEAGDAAALAREADIPEGFFLKLIGAFEGAFFSFLEINPLVVQGEEAYVLDAAALVDSAGEFFATKSWSEADLVKSEAKHPAEEKVRALQETSPASLKLTVLNPDGSLFFLLSGGGGSIVIADEAHARGKGKDIGNYGEYSGGPTREETYLYAKEVLRVILSSKARRKALIVAGGVANFTDVKSTFAGIIDALGEVANDLKKRDVRVFVRRGGPREAEGLALMEKFLREAGLLGSVHGSDAVITTAIDEAIDYVS